MHLVLLFYLAAICSTSTLGKRDRGIVEEITSEQRLRLPIRQEHTGSTSWATAPVAQISPLRKLPAFTEKEYEEYRSNIGD